MDLATLIEYFSSMQAHFHLFFSVYNLHQEMMILNHYHVGIYTIGLLSNEFEVDVARLTFHLYPVVPPG